ncbi:hypothetical protein [Methylibium sp.]|uniref:hypothetical protein n=1 Tax=Methylibium sp. TaxID=2067992 RepID=UPI00286BF365|nr:hypothetical protein [Methylibium sp.]
MGTTGGTFSIAGAGCLSAAFAAGRSSALAAAGLAAGAIAGVVGVAARAKSTADSVIIASLLDSIAALDAFAFGRTAGTVSGGNASLRGMSIGMSTGSGLGAVSNKSGKPTTPSNTNNDAPIRRRLARTRDDPTESPSVTGVVAGAAAIVR